MIIQAKKIYLSSRAFIYPLCIGIASCTPLPITQPKDIEGKKPANHTPYTIQLDKNGNLLKPGTRTPYKTLTPSKNTLETCHYLYNPDYSKTEQSYYDTCLAETQYVYEIAENIKKEITNRKDKEGIKPIKGITIHIHGGLNTIKHADNKAKSLYSKVLLDGQYPIFINWDSGLLSSYPDHLVLIRKGLHQPLLGLITFPFVLIEDTLRSIVHMPSALYTEVASLAATSTRIQSESEKDYEQRENELEKLGFEVISEGPFRGVASNYKSIINPAKILGTPLVDGFGTGSWRAMLRRADMILEKSIAYEGEGPRPITKATFVTRTDHTQTAAKKLLEMLSSHDELKDLEITLIGHSMGTIAATEILAKFQNLKIKNLVFMGAAVRLKDVQNIVSPWLESHPSAQFWSLSLDPYREMGENNFLDTGPRGSLLHMIDFTFAEVNSFKDRTAGSWWNITRTADILFPASNSLRSRVHLTRFPIGPDCKWPQKHGDFNEFTFWKDEFWKGGDRDKNLYSCSSFYIESKS